ncbi:MAG: efflux RND transporter periplasmic adaptor subunit [Alkalilacustris sp.]
MRFLSRSLVAVFLLAVTLGLLALAAHVVLDAMAERRDAPAPGRPGQERVLAVPVVTVSEGQAVPLLEAFGEVHARRSLELRTAAAGPVAELAPGFEDGAAVTAGQILLRIDPAEATATRDLARADLRRAEADLADALRAAELAQEDLDAAQIQADLRARTLARQRDLAGRGVGAEAAAEEAELALAAARQAIVSRRQALAAAEGRAAQAEAALQRAQVALADADRRLADTTLRAPFSGRLAHVAVVEGGLMTANERIATLIDPQALEIRFRLPAAQYARLLDEQGALRPMPVTAGLEVEGMGLRAEGRLDRVGPAVGEGQAGRVLHAVLDAPRGLLPGDFVRVSVEEPPLDGVARLPAAAVSAAGRVLVVGEGDRLVEAPVDVLRRIGDAVLIAAPGLDGAEVVAARTPLLGPGLRVRPLRAPAPEDAADGLVELTPDRRAALIARIEASPRMPDAAKARLIDQLSAETVPASLVTRLESRLGG